MKFSEYCDIMQNRGINELSFAYNGHECIVEMVTENFSEFVQGASLKVVYIVGWDAFEFNSFDELLNARIFDDKTLEEIWDEIYDVTFNGESEEDFISNDDGLTFVERMELAKKKYIDENGIKQWEFRLSRKHSFWYLYKFGLLGAVLGAALLSIPMLFSVHWIYMIVVGVSVAFALILGAIVGYNNKTIISYEITTKKIIVFNGLDCQTSYDNIRKVTMHKYRNKSGCGVIQIYVSKGLSLNFRMVHVTDVENVYKLIMNNLENARYYK